MRWVWTSLIVLGSPTCSFAAEPAEAQTGRVADRIIAGAVTIARNKAPKRKGAVTKNLSADTVSPHLGEFGLFLGKRRSHKGTRSIRHADFLVFFWVFVSTLSCDLSTMFQQRRRFWRLVEGNRSDHHTRRHNGAADRDLLPGYARTASRHERSVRQWTRL